MATVNWKELLKAYGRGAREEALELSMAFLQDLIDDESLNISRFSIETDEHDNPISLRLEIKP